MPTSRLAMIAAATLSLSACCTVPSMPQTIPRTPPYACLTDCPPLEKPVEGTDRAVRLWEYDTIERYGECRRLHATCVEWVK